MKHLCGVVKQKLDITGDLSYRGIVHFFGAKLPVHIEITPTNKIHKGERVYYIHTIDNIEDYEPKNASEKEAKHKYMRHRTYAEKKVVEILNKICIMYKREMKRRKK